jgi:thioredoxin 1
MITVKKFSAAWCGPCRMLAPVFNEQIKPQFTTVKFEDIDVDTNPDEVVKYGVTSVPTVVLVKDGVEFQRFTGVQSKLAYTNAINEAIG